MNVAGEVKVAEKSKSLFTAPLVDRHDLGDMLYALQRCGFAGRLIKFSKRNMIS